MSGNTVVYASRYATIKMPAGRCRSIAGRIKQRPPAWTSQVGAP